MTSKEGPFIYCLNKDNGEVLWKYNYPIGNGNELTTPLIIGELLILSTSSGGLYCFDRFSGEVLWIEEIPFNPPLDENGNISWSGRTFLSGPSTPAYDSGAVYFGAADGKVYCYKVTKEKPSRSGFMTVKAVSITLSPPLPQSTANGCSTSAITKVTCMP